MDEIRATLLNAQRPTVLGVSETWLDKSVHDGEVDVSTCTLYQRDRAVGRGGGILVYVHNSIRSRHRPDLEVKDVQAVWVELHLKSDTVLLYNLYCPPNSNLQSIHAISNMIEPAVTENKTVVLMGDLNCNLMTVNHLGEHFLLAMEDLLLTQLMKDPTRITRIVSLLCCSLICVRLTNIINISIIAVPINGRNGTFEILSQLFLKCRPFMR